MYKILHENWHQETTSTVHSISLSQTLPVLENLLLLKLIPKRFIIIHTIVV